MNGITPYTFFTTRDVAEVLACSAVNVWRLVKSGRLHPQTTYLYPRQMFFHPNDIESYLDDVESGRYEQHPTYRRENGDKCCLLTEFLKHQRERLKRIKELKEYYKVTKGI